MALPPIWPQPKTQPDAPALAEQLGVSPLCATLLINRGLADAEQARRFLVPGDPVVLPPLAQTEWLLNRLRLAVDNDETVAVWGDYDVDGLTGSTLLIDFLRRRGVRTVGYNPHRLQEGYGLNVPGLCKLQDQGVGLVFTVDCGISNVAEVAAANGMGVDVVITDHHDIPPVLPPAACIINHKLGDDPLLKQLAGVGVVYQLACSLMPHWPAEDCPEDYLDLLALGTVADVAPLQGYNRDLVRAGLEALNWTVRPGLRALIDVANLGDRAPTATDIGFRIGPRLNAVGRMAHPDLALKLLLCQDPDEAAAIAQQVNDLNVERQALVARIQEQAEAMVAECIDLDREPLIALCHPDWHHGVIGIVCSRLMEQFGRPVFLGCDEGDQVRGSARSPGGLSISEALQGTARHLLKFGGHAPAGGFTLARAEWEAWREALLTHAAARLNAPDLRPVLAIEAAPDMADLSLATYEEIVSLAPFGAKNPEPVLAAWGAQVVEQKLFGKGNEHRRLILRAGDDTLETILWRGAETPVPDTIDLAYRLEVNEWRGQVSLRLNLQAWRPHVGPDPVEMNALNRFEEAGHADHVALQPQPGDQGPGDTPAVAVPVAVVPAPADGQSEAAPAVPVAVAPAGLELAAVAPTGLEPAAFGAAMAEPVAVAVLDRPELLAADDAVTETEPLAEAHALLAIEGVVPAVALDADVLPWSLTALLDAPAQVGRLFLPDGTVVGLPGPTVVAPLGKVDVVDRRDTGTPAEGDGSLRDIMTFRNDVVTAVSGPVPAVGALALAGLPEDGPTLRQLVGACGIRRLLLCQPAVPVPTGVTADWLHRLKGLMDEPDLYRAAWERLGSPPTLVRWGLRLLADVGEVVETAGVTRRGRVRGGRLLWELPQYDGYRRWADQRRAYWQLLTAGTAADIQRWLEGTTDGD
jgi:single-stranded-DNA-specific exonuclease